MNLRKRYRQIAALAFAAFLTGCGNDIPSVPEDSGMEGTGNVTLSLNIALSESGIGAKTRAPFPDSDDLTFEGPVSDYEKLHTLRVVIVHAGEEKTGVVEHNRMVLVEPSTGAILNDDLRFKVSSGERKHIYLFANEAAVSYDFSSIAKDELFPKTEVESIRLSRKSNASLVDNSASSVEKSFIPMSEMFEIDVPVPESPVDFFRTEHLFVTRSAIKFSFHFSVAEDYPSEGVSVTGIKLYGLADECYYLPRNTMYDPGKYAVSGNPSGGRVITAFETPADTPFSDYMFAPVSPIEIKPGMEATLSPYVYFPESKQDGQKHFRLSVALDNGTELLTPRDLTLDEIPRNTHVKINIEMKSTDAKASVTLLPYTGISLEPDFGL